MSKLKAKEPQAVEPGRVQGCVFGAPGVGKTWFALTFPKPYYIDTEGGADLAHYTARLKQHGGAYLGPEDGACDLDTILDQIKALATEKHPYQTLVIDSISKAFGAAVAREQDRLGDKDAFGASKKAPIQKMRQIVAWLSRLDMHVWFVAHELPIWGGEGKDRRQIGYGPDVWDKLIYELDLTLRFEKGGPKNRSAWVHKSRLTGFEDGARFDVQRQGEDVAFAEFTARWGKDFKTTDAKVIVLAKPEQVAEIERLVGLLKIDAEEQQKLLDKAGAESWAELTTDQADKAISFWKKKLA